MPQQGITFDGAYIGLPGAYYADDVSAAAPNTPPTTPPMVFIGYGWGPKPKTPITFTNPQDLLNALRGAPAAAFVPFIANPSPALNGAQLVTFIDASTNTQSNALLASGASGLVALTSTLYGPPSNQIQYQVQAASQSASGVKLILTDNFANTQVIGDNLGVPLEVAYVGLATGSVTYTVVTNPSGGATSGTFALSSPIAGESFSVTLGSGGYATTSQLVDILNGTSTCVAQGLSSTGGQLPSQWLTPKATISLPVSGSGSPNFVPVVAQQYDVAFWVNQFASGIASGTVSGSTYTLPATGFPTYFSGANGVPPTNNDYASALNVALTVPAWTVFCDSNLPAVQALMAQHVETASSAPYGMWRRGFTGSSIGDSVSVTQTAAQALDSLQMNYVYPGIYRINTATGANQLYGGLYAAAAAAAMATGNQIAQPLTNKVLNGTGLEKPSGNPLTTSQLIALQNSGVMALWTPPQTNLPTILSDITTWQVDNNVENTSSQQVACRYWLAYSVTNVLQRYVGTIAAPSTEINILNALKQLLNALIFTGGASNGVLASWDKSSLVLQFNGTQQLASVTFSATLVGQNRYITVFASIQPLQFTITST